MDISETLCVTSRQEWRRWLIDNHATVLAIWLVYPRKSSGKARIPYDEAVEEALCFGWIDGIQKKLDAESTVQRFTPRRPKSNWSELNKERARQMIASGQMTEAGHAVLCDLSTDTFVVADDIRDALKADAQTWEYFQQLPGYYQRIRVGFVEEARNRPELFNKRLTYFVNKTAKNERFGTMR